MADFDIDGVNRRYAVTNRGLRFLLPSMIVLSSSLAVIICVRGLGSALAHGFGTPFSEMFWFVIASCVVFAAIAGCAIPNSLPGARSISVTTGGIQLIYSDKKSSTLPWRAGRWSITLYDYSASRRMVGRGFVYFIHVSRLGRRSVLSAEAYREILAVAGQSKSTIRTYRGSRAIYGVSVLVHRISSAPA
jgi:hypothetical protein